MKLGKVTQTVRKRSVLKQLKSKRQEIFPDMTVEETCWGDVYKRQVYDRADHKWTDMTEWAFLGYQERKKAMLGKEYEPPIYLD